MFDLLSPQTLAAFLSLAAAIGSAVAAWRSPISAARFAESLRRETQTREQRERMKLYVFTTLMQERAAMFSPDCVKALNLIDVVFSESISVKNCWSDLYSGYQKDRLAPDHVQDERRKKLLAAMAVDLNLSESLRASDIDRIYYPESVALENEAKRLQQLDILNRLRGASAQSANATPASSAAIWPPPP